VSETTASTSPAAKPKLRHYAGWGLVPSNLATATRLRELDLPRQPGPIAAIVTGGDYRRKSDVFDLYDITTSPPTTATAKQLEAAAARRKFNACTECGAHPDTGLSQVTGRCEACLFLEKLRKAQLTVQSQREDCRLWAAKHLDDPKTVVAWIDEHTPPAPPSGRRREPVAHTLTIVTPAGKEVLRLTYRLPGVGPRVRAVPKDAAPYDDAAAAVAALGERYFVTWTHSHLWRLARLSTGKVHSFVGVAGAEMDVRVQYWRGDIDPRTALPRRAVPPGNAERLALLLRRMAAGTHPAGGD
jgi:hypothetical protein